jgi:toxin ParE1/3/4
MCCVNLTIKFELEARVELIRTREHYRNITPALGQEFSSAFKECLKNISDFPETFKDLGDDVRRASVPKFPYFVYFVVDPDCIFIYAIAHQKQDQTYWRNRTRPS